MTHGIGTLAPLGDISGGSNEFCGVVHKILHGISWEPFLICIHTAGPPSAAVLARCGEAAEASREDARACQIGVKFWARNKFGKCYSSC